MELKTRNSSWVSTRKNILLIFYLFNYCNPQSIKVTKQIPIMCIVLSKIPLDTNEPGYIICFLLILNFWFNVSFYYSYQTKDTISEIFKVTSQKPSKNKSNRTTIGEEIYVKKKKTNKNK